VDRFDVRTAPSELAVEEIADVLDDFRPPDFMPVDVAAQLAPPRMIDANELLWAARILSGLVRVHRNVIPDMREKVKLARAILESYADVRGLRPAGPAVGHHARLSRQPTGGHVPSTAKHIWWLCG